MPPRISDCAGCGYAIILKDGMIQCDCELWDFEKGRLLSQPHSHNPNDSFMGAKSDTGNLDSGEIKESQTHLGQITQEGDQTDVPSFCQDGTKKLVPKSDREA